MVNDDSIVYIFGGIDLLFSQNNNKNVKFIINKKSFDL